MKRTLVTAFVVSALVGAGATSAVLSRGGDDGPGGLDVARAYVDGMSNADFRQACESLAPSLVGGTGPKNLQNCALGYAQLAVYAGYEFSTLRVKDSTYTENGDKAKVELWYDTMGGDGQPTPVRLRATLERLPDIGWRVVELS